MIVTPIKRYEPCAIDLGHTCYRLRPLTRPQGDRSHDNENDDDNAVVLYIVTSCVQKCLRVKKQKWAIFKEQRMMITALKAEEKYTLILIILITMICYDQLKDPDEGVSNWDNR